jgi:hypothetical protein
MEKTFLNPDKSELLMEALYDEAIRDVDMSPEELRATMRILKELEDDGDSRTLELLEEVDYRRKPPTILEFIEDDYYMGRVCNEIPEENQKGMYPKWREAALADFDPGRTVPVNQAIFTGCIGSGKTFTGCLYVLYRATHTLCLRNPLLYYGLSRATSIVISFFSVTQKQVQGGSFSDCTNMLHISPFFGEMVRDTAANRKYSNRRVELDNNLVIEAGSQAREALGRNTLVSLIDEVNFRLEKEAAEAARDLVSNIERRFESRFAGAKDGLLVIISSAKDEGDFLVQHIAKNRNKPHVVVHDYPIWETSGPVKINYCGEKFVVDIGDNTNPPRILTDDEEIERTPASRKMTVPTEYRVTFDDDLTGSIRDLGGVSTGRIAKYFPNTMHLFNSLIDEPGPLTLETVRMSIDSTHNLKDIVIPERMFQIIESRRQPVRHPYAPRFVHFDISSGAMDAMGITMLHPVGLTEVDVRDIVTNRTESLMRPVVEVDFSLAVVRDISRELIDFGRIREWIHWLKIFGGFRIVKVSADLLSMSGETLGIFKQLGYETELISVDRKKDPYDTMKQTIHEDRFRMPRNDLFMLEALNLEDTGDKIDHPEKFTAGWLGEGAGMRASKDVTDSVAGAVFSCERHPETMAMPRLESVIERMLAGMDSTRREPTQDAPQDEIMVM